MAGPDDREGRVDPALVERLYDAFAGVPKPERLEACPHCHSPGEECKLLGPLLRDVDAEAVADYVFSAMLTLGTAADFRYFVPRIFELVVAGRFTGRDVEVPFVRLHDAGWTGWPAPQRSALVALLDGFWDASLARYPGDYAIDEILCGLGNAFDSLPQFLERWFRGVSQESFARHLAGFVVSNVGPARGRGRLANAWWPRPPRPAEAQAVAWLLSGRLREEVEACFYVAETPATEDALDAANTYLYVPGPDPPPVPPTRLVGRAASEFIAMIAERNTRARRERLARAKEDAAARGKEPFDLALLETMCDTTHEGRLDPVDVRQAEFEEKYYVSFPDIHTLAEFAEKVTELSRW